MIKLITGNPINNKDNTVYREFNKGNNTAVFSVPQTSSTTFSIIANFPAAKLVHITSEHAVDEIYFSNGNIILPTLPSSFTTNNIFFLLGGNELFLKIDSTTDPVLFIHVNSASDTRIILNFYNG